MPPCKDRKKEDKWTVVSRASCGASSTPPPRPPSSVQSGSPVHFNRQKKFNNLKWLPGCSHIMRPIKHVAQSCDFPLCLCSPMWCARMHQPIRIGRDKARKAPWHHTGMELFCGDFMVLECFFWEYLKSMHWKWTMEGLWMTSVDARIFCVWLQYLKWPLENVTAVFYQLACIQFLSNTQMGGVTNVQILFRY